MFSIRRYLPSDQPAVEHLHIFAIQRIGAYLGRGPWDDDIYSIQQAYLDNGGEFLIGEYNGQLIAMGALKRTTPDRAEIKRMRILPEYQGRGYGQLILTELEARARTLGYHTLHLDTSIVQVPAQKLYEKNGYHEIGRTHLPQHIDKDTQQMLEVILYEKNLT